MADEKRKPNKELEKSLDQLQSRIDTVYRATYASDKTNIDALTGLTTDIQNRVKQLSSASGDDSTSTLVRLLSRGKKQEREQIAKSNEEIIQMFQSKSITDGLLHDYISNTAIAEFDKEIDILCRYMPSLKRALEILKNATLSSDSFNKDIITVTFTGVSEEESKLHAENYDKMMAKYKLIQKISDWYDSMSYYGESFIYRVPYKQEIKSLLSRKDQTRKLNGLSAPEMGSVHEMTIYDEESPVAKGSKGNSSKPGIKVLFDNTGILESKVAEYTEALEKSGAITEQLTLRSKYLGVVNEVNPVKSVGKLDTTVSDELTISPQYSSEGLIDRDKTSERVGNINVNGVVITRLKRENIILVYINDTCLGYYYFEVRRKDLSTDFSTKLSPRTTMLDDRCQVHNKSVENKFTDNFLNYLSNSIALKIDSDFVNKNPDLQKEIYALLKHNDIFNDANTTEFVKVSFIPAEDVTHMYFKQDPETHRGISDLEDALLPATFWCCLSLSDLIGQLTRAQDHRVYYVKQSVEQNIAQTLMNVINQVKKGNFGLRQIQTMNQVLNVIGQYNDFVIPVGQNGESPIQFEVMEGQRLEPKDELKQKFHDEAIGNIVPPELVEQRADFATQVTSSNIQLIRRVFSRQAILEAHLDDLLTHIYNYEYGTNVRVKTHLPPPIFLVMSNFNQIFDVVNQNTQSLAQIIYSNTSDPDEQAKMAIFIKKRILQQLSTYVRIDELDELMQEVDKEFALAKKNQQEDNMY